MGGVGRVEVTSAGVLVNNTTSKITTNLQTIPRQLKPEPTRYKKLPTCAFQTSRHTVEPRETRGD